MILKSFIGCVVLKFLKAGYDPIKFQMRTLLKLDSMVKAMLSE